MSVPPLRPSERVMGFHFVYILAVAILVGLPAQRLMLTALYAAIVWAGFLRLAWKEKNTGKTLYPVLRDWAPLAFTLLAYREMDLFSPPVHDNHLEKVWILWDRALLYDYGFKAAIESAGRALPVLLEFAYLVVYAVGPFAVAVLYLRGKRERAETVVLYYVTGTLMAYALFPYFPSEPPRTVFPGEDVPEMTTWLRSRNLSVVGSYGIHSSVFPSAHVSSAFSAAFGMLVAYPERRRWGIGLLIYAVLVSLATIYGRYHYAIDAVAGVGVALVAAVVARFAIIRWGREGANRSLSLQKARE